MHEQQMRPIQPQRQASSESRLQVVPTIVYEFGGAGIARFGLAAKAHNAAKSQPMERGCGRRPSRSASLVSKVLRLVLRTQPRSKIFFGREGFDGLQCKEHMENGIHRMVARQRIHRAGEP